MIYLRYKYLHFLPIVNELAGFHLVMRSQKVSRISTNGLKAYPSQKWKSCMLHTVWTTQTVGF